MTQKYFNEIEFAIIKRLCKYGLNISEAENVIYPLSWHVSTGRIPTHSLKKLVESSARQLTTIAKRLISDKSHDDIIKNVMAYIDIM